MSDCDTCEREGVCDYQHKPCDCVGYRKFVPAAMEFCGPCGGSGWLEYPIRCRACNGCGYVRKKPPNTALSGRGATDEQNGDRT